MVINIISTCLCLWTVYEARRFIETVDELQTQTLRRINDILDECLQLKGTDDKRPKA